MQMIGHQYIGIYDQSFFLLAINQTVENNISIHLSAENIGPAYNGKRNKMQSILINNFVSIQSIVLQLQTYKNVVYLQKFLFFDIT